MKKLLSFALLTAVAVTAFLFASCDSLSQLANKDNGDHTHKFEVESTTATCTEAGTATYVCSCGETYSTPVSAFGHDNVKIASTPATCTQEGSVCYECSRCHVGSCEAIPVLGHNYSCTENTATCLKAGSKAYSCTRCESTYSETIPALDHDYKLQGVTNPTCTEDGQACYLCARCYQEKSDTIASTGHNMVLEESVIATCEEGGYDFYYCTKCFETEKRNETAALNHIFTFPDGDYFRMVKCERSGCEACARRDSENTYADVLVYVFDDEFVAEIDKLFKEASDAVNELATYNEETDAYVAGSDKAIAAEAFRQAYCLAIDRKYCDVDIQHAVCTLNYNFTNGEDGWDEELEKISNFYDDFESRYYPFLKRVYDSEYREYIFSRANGWTEKGIAEMLTDADAMINERYVELSSRANEILIASREDDADIPTLYHEFVGIKNEIAGLYGYDNYMEYAYKEIYGRDYTPAEVESMRDFVKQYFGGTAFFEIEVAYEISAMNLKGASADALKSVENGAVMTDAFAANLIADYYTYLDEVLDESGIGFYETLNNSFKDGLAFTGLYERAYTVFLDGSDFNLYYFGPGHYSSSFTFVHEFGHYMSFEYLEGFGFGFDCAETHSQGDEMLFMAYLGTCLSEMGCEEAFDVIRLSNYADGISCILLATCVDEFEQIVYTNSYSGNNADVIAILEDGEIDADEYQPLFSALMTEYDASGILSAEYWSWVVIESPGYYISYAMSQIPVMSLYLDAKDDFEVGAEEYAKLFTFKNEEEYFDAECNEVLAGYIDILDYAGIGNSFTESTYTGLFASIIEYVAPKRVAIDYYLNIFGIESTLITE